MTPRAFWWGHARWPIVAFVVIASLLASTSFDFVLARAVFFDPESRSWLGGNAWWANAFMHTGGRWFIRLIVVLSIVGWLSGQFNPRLPECRRAAAYLALAIILSTGIVGLLKSVTNIDCPVDLAAFGGDRPYVGLLENRPDALPRARCFPSAHASSGYSLVALYFVWYERSRRRAVAGAVTGLGMGILFGIAQQARGAHFLSHDVWSAGLAWLTCLTLYVYGFRARLYERAGSVVSFARAHSLPFPARGPVLFGRESRR